MTPMELHDMLGMNATVTDCFTGRGTHRGCGECCSRFVPLAFSEAVILKYAARNGAYVRPQECDFDFICPFLTPEKECSVYDDRPWFCRFYNCAEHVSGELMLKLMRMGRRDAVMYDLRELVEDE